MPSVKRWFSFVEPRWSARQHFSLSAFSGDRDMIARRRILRGVPFVVSGYGK
jgi:hypothetical protein